jgi:predicted nucleotidyltransferase
VVHGHLGGLASGTFGYDGGTRTLTLDPDRSFHAGEVLRVSATSGIRALDAVPLTPYGWQFRAGPVRDRSFAGFGDIGTGLDGVWLSSVAWADYDNDGDLDILLTGDRAVSPDIIPVAKLYRNDGGGSQFTLVEAYDGVRDGSVAWGDYDDDGDLDLLLTGSPGRLKHPKSRVYRNDGGATFTDIGAGLTGVDGGSVAWGDYDNDGDLDILLTGFDNADNPVSKVYRNDGGHFTDIVVGLTGVAASSVAWGDYDNDGDLDILLTGGTGGGRVSKVYRNDGRPGSPGFTDISAGLTDVWDGSVAWGDYDNDGDLDILLTGVVGSGGYVSNVYRNDGGGSFGDIGAGLTGVAGSSVAWGDYDNDGDLDILLTGVSSGWSPVSKVYRNDGDGAFTDIGAGLTRVKYGSAAWGDYDNDGDLDILLTGEGSADPHVSKVYRNNSRPELGTVTPSSGTGPVGATTYFTTTWSDPDGWDNLKQCYSHIGASPSLPGNVTLLYNAAKDKLWLLDDSATTWLGGCQPGDANTAANSQATLHCMQTTVQSGGDTLGVRWAIEFKPGFEGAKKLGLKCKDRDKAKAKGRWKGTWTIE